MVNDHRLHLERWKHRRVGSVRIDRKIIRTFFSAYYGGLYGHGTMVEACYVLQFGLQWFQVADGVPHMFLAMPGAGHAASGASR